MAWYDQDVRFDDGGLGDALIAARRLLGDVRDTRASLARNARASWRGPTRVSFDREDAALQRILDELTTVLVSASADLAARSVEARSENRRRAARRAAEAAARRAREQAALQADSCPTPQRPTTAAGRLA